MSSVILSERKKYAMLDKTTVPDGYGGFTSVYVQGAEFYATVILQDDAMTKIANAISQKTTYRIFTEKNLVLNQGDKFIDLETNQKYVVTLSNEDKKTPKMSNLNIRYTDCEEWNVEI